MKQFVVVIYLRLDVKTCFSRGLVTPVPCGRAAMYSDVTTLSIELLMIVSRFAAS